jgi:hypothetical protein
MDQISRSLNIILVEVTHTKCEGDSIIRLRNISLDVIAEKTDRKSVTVVKAITISRISNTLVPMFL